MVFYIANARAVLMCDSLVTALDAGAGPAVLIMYDGTVPANVGIPIGGQVAAATLTFAATAFQGSVANGNVATATANPIVPDSNAAGSANPVTFYRAQDSNGLEVWQGAIGTGSGEIDLNSTLIGAGAEVSLTSMTVSVPENA